MNAFLLIGLLALSAGVSGSQTIPIGTVLPARLNTTLSSNNSKPGQQFTARLMQDVRLPDGTVIHAGSKLLGHVIRVDGASATEGAGIAFQFDRLKTRRSLLPLTVSLRAIASFMETDAAQIPDMGPDRGTSPESYDTVQVGGDDVYRGGGPVMYDGQVVGRPVPGGVLVHLRANPEGGCRGASGADDRPQAMWVFSSGACGVYGLRGLKITRAGRQAPAGEIVLNSANGKLNVPGGTGLLLRVVRQDT